jgi:O-acetyl-ADP-ribose deacetylase (regulator of RNase III)
MPMLHAIQADIISLSVDAIGNGANESLLGGGGLDGEIHRVAGPALFDECERLGSCQTGEAEITNRFDLNAKLVIHTVGPEWRGGRNGGAELLWSCYCECIVLAQANNVSSIAFPAISASVFG